MNTKLSLEEHSGEEDDKRILETIWKTHLEGKAWQVKDEFLGLLQFCLDNKVKNIA